ncbi:lipid A export permease/ATP-binding protein MsbA [Candidatus Berkiella cookevillensis]|uniref:Lipid A export ATP-binding/permease protein MsbA n=2 Tax=Candidatus Berkiella cookevillensis TaxID=437022 RepID=A0A0Q9YTQ0_9GAMM|nr:lipid A export permease/ATP-binding protein MsbA [Candidatus Berkiella cookevillensis]
MHTNPMKNRPIDSQKKVYKRLLSYVWPYRAAFFLALFGNLLYGVVDAGFIKLFEPLLNKGFVDRDQNFIQWIPIMVISIFFVRGIATFLSTYFMGWVGRNVVMNFRQQMFQHLLKLPTYYYDRITSGEILSKITYNVEQVADACSDAITVMVRESCTAIALIAVMVSISWRLTLLFAITVPIMAGIMHFVSKRMRSVSAYIQESMGRVTHVAEEAIEGQKVIKAFGGQAYELSRFAKATQYNRHQEMKLIVTSAISIPMIQIVGAVALAFTVYLATLNPEHTMRTAITPGAFAAMITAMIALLKPIKQLTKVNSNIQKGIAGAASIFAFLDEETEIDKAKTSITSRMAGNIAFKHVSFSYKTQNPENPLASTLNQQTLDNISFEAKAGETIAIVGRSGGGKSTIVNLLPRFYEAQGQISIDGVDVKDIPLKDLRRNISIVSQQVTLFNDSIAKNIAYGTDATMEEIQEAAKLAHAFDFIERLSQGFDTVIGENGIRLSGGQRQRIAIARAILKKAPILILDEATSSLDTESERHIQSALDKLMSQCTTLVIAHRLSTIQNADRIMVIDKGKIIELGTHEELMASKGLYSSLRVMQYQERDFVPEIVNS